MKKFELKYTIAASVGEKTTQVERVEIIEAETFYLGTDDGVQFYNRKGDIVAACPINRVVLVKELKA